MKKLLCFALTIVLLFSVMPVALAADTVPKEDYDALKDKYDELQEMYDKLLADYEELKEELDKLQGVNVGEESKSDNSYQSILDDYTKRLQEATPGLIEQFAEKAAGNTGGLTGLASISNDMVSELAEIATEGTQEMAKIYMFSGSGTQDEYQEWAGKLQDVYMEEAAKIQDAYLKAAMG